MKTIWYILYNFLIIPFLYLVIRLLGFFNNKVKRGIKGRDRIFEELILNSATLDKSKKLIWFHSSSLGEFEQAKPIIKELKKGDNINILITFFSPSGYENSRKYPYADLVSYIPLDTHSNAERFISIVRPDLAVMMRYDIWPNHVWAMKKYNIPSIIVDATMKDNSARKLPLAKSFHKYLFGNISTILAVSESDVQGFKEFNVPADRVKAVGDTRFDRVYQRSIVARGKNLIKENLLKDKNIFVAGSTWQLDEDVILPAFAKLSIYDSDTVMIIAPHEPTEVHLERIENEFAGTLETIRFSFMNNYNNERVIIVDSIGILLTLYTYADLAFVGGSFKQSIHNVLEAAVYGIPVMFGPKIENSQESQQLLKRGGGILIKNKSEAYRQLRTMFNNDKLRKAKGKISFDYVKENLGATEKILEEIYKII
ncbi:MAG TPA: glycosyltransferase N-terminal domain-containing protein [Ignavibacteriaceae bacterium]|nr:glycosyltransferase N-terminal domain-containing protein [Ignavibacteriaceae bacterium]